MAELRLPLPAGLVEDPSRANWGLTEIAIARVEEATMIDGRPAHRLLLSWETDRRIEAVFERLTVEERRVGDEA